MRLPRRLFNVPTSGLLIPAFVAVSGSALLSAVSVHASVINYDVSGVSGGNPVDAEATITTLTNAIDISLTDLEPNLISAGEEVSGIVLTLSVKPTSVSIGSSSGILIDAPSTTPLGGSIADHWGVGASNFTVTLETAGPDAAGGQPYDLIIGPGVGGHKSIRHQPRAGNRRDGRLRFGSGGCYEHHDRNGSRLFVWHYT
jgi:hypothetical protein